MVMRVDQSRQDDLICGRDLLGRLESPCQLGSRTHRNDAVSPDGHHALIDNPPGRIHGDYGPS